MLNPHTDNASQAVQQATGVASENSIRRGSGHDRIRT